MPTEDKINASLGRLVPMILAGAILGLLPAVLRYKPKLLAVSSSHRPEVLVPRTRYTCRRCSGAREAYRAWGNAGQWAHLCAQCWCWLPPQEQDSYIELRG